MIYPKDRKPSMVQLSGDGKTEEAPVSGKQRIYSRKDTEAIVTAATQAKSPREFLRLGKLIYEATKRQDETEPEYTEE